MADVIALPPLPGLPDVVLTDPATLPAGLTEALTADTFSVLAALGPPVWGIYQNGAPVILADTVVDLGYNKAFVISDYPTEEGGFASFNSVETPAEARVRFVSGGSPEVRQVLLSSIEAIVGDLNFYDIATPDRVYPNANLIRYEYRRSAQEAGASLLVVDVTLQEVRVAPTAGSHGGQNTKDPASADMVDNGTIQSGAPIPTQSTGALPFFASGVALPPTLGGTGF